ncbi:TIGR02444 family protein [Govanella unica]|uniref:TIGR02444 family protein n=1 Tax=Govanella unica TaxID=2975056 RepID=A0A9X3TZZ8_9PROT|nr:TIGR02444 family protein [Govania unica]MDA5194860.1 TIGR02444 family protein [Govania unica]
MNKEINSPFPNPFWDYALRIYGRAAVRDLCLMLQDQQGADINLILFLLWRDDCGVAPPDPDDLDAMTATLLPVRLRAIEPLRGLRRIMKRPFPDDLPVLRENLRQRLLEAELAAEAVAQTLLYTRFPVEDSGAPAHKAAQAITGYLRHIGVDPRVAEDAATRLDAALA